MAARRIGWLLAAIGIAAAAPATAGTSYACMLQVSTDGVRLSADQMIRKGQSALISTDVTVDFTGIAPADTYFTALLGTRFDPAAPAHLWLTHIALTRGAPVRWRLIGAGHEHVETTRFRYIRPLDLDWARLDAEFAGEDSIRVEVTEMRHRKPIVSGTLRLGAMRAAMRLRPAALAALTQLSADPRGNCSPLDQTNDRKRFDLDCSSGNPAPPAPDQQAVLAVFQHQARRRCSASWGIEKMEIIVTG